MSDSNRPTGECQHGVRYGDNCDMCRLIDNVTELKAQNIELNDQICRMADELNALRALARAVRNHRRIDELKREYLIAPGEPTHDFLWRLGEQESKTLFAVDAAMRELEILNHPEAQAAAPARAGEPVRETYVPVPTKLIFLPNGLTAVFDQHGKQMPKYQRSHAKSVHALYQDGIAWRSLSVTGLFRGYLETEKPSETTLFKLIDEPKQEPTP